MEHTVFENEVRPWLRAGGNGILSVVSGDTAWTMLARPGASGSSSLRVYGRPEPAVSAYGPRHNWSPFRLCGTYDREMKRFISSNYRFDNNNDSAVPEKIRKAEARIRERSDEILTDDMRRRVFTMVAEDSKEQCPITYDAALVLNSVALSGQTAEECLDSILTEAIAKTHDGQLDFPTDAKKMILMDENCMEEKAQKFAEERLAYHLSYLKTTVVPVIRYLETHRQMNPADWSDALFDSQTRILNVLCRYGDILKQAGSAVSVMRFCGEGASGEAELTADILYAHLRDAACGGSRVLTFAGRYKVPAANITSVSVSGVTFRF